MKLRSTSIKYVDRSTINTGCTASWHIKAYISFGACTYVGVVAILPKNFLVHLMSALPLLPMFI